MFLREHEEYLLSDIWDEAGISINQGYKALEKARDLGLISTRTDSSKYPPRNIISLTQKGKKIASKLREIEEILD